MLDSIFNASYSKQELSEFRLMLKSTIFKGMSNKELAAFRETWHLRKYRRDEVIFFRNDPAQAAYLLKNGEVDLLMDFDESNEVLVKLRQGASFGENAIFEGMQRPYSAVVTSEDAEIYLFPQISLQEVMSRKPAWKAKLLSNLLLKSYDFEENLFDVYRRSHGFFELKQIFERS